MGLADFNGFQLSEALDLGNPLQSASPTTGRRRRRRRQRRQRPRVFLIGTRAGTQAGKCYLSCRSERLDFANEVSDEKGHRPTPFFVVVSVSLRFTHFLLGLGFCDFHLEFGL